MNNLNTSEVLACPLCGGGIGSVGGNTVCAACGKVFQSDSDGLADFRTSLANVDGSWSAARFDAAYSSAVPQDSSKDYIGLGIPEFAEDYRRREKDSVFFRIMEDARPKVVLDAGCGDGWFLCELARRNTETVFHGVDVSPFRIRMLRDRISAAGLGGRMAAHLSNAERVPFKDGAFDLVLMREVLEHISGPGAAIKEASRVLKSGGTLVLTTPVKYLFRAWVAAAFLPSLIKRICRGQKLSRGNGGAVYDRPVASAFLRECFAESGLEVVSWERKIILPHESYLQFIPMPMLRMFISLAELFKKAGLSKLLGLHHVIALKKK
jgi:ubiquinone/menaquinone biosynthesis C-methylase UbiE